MNLWILNRTEAKLFLPFVDATAKTGMNMLDFGAFHEKNAYALTCKIHPSQFLGHFKEPHVHSYKSAGKKVSHRVPVGGV